MAERISSIQGTEDLLPGQWGHWRRLYAAARRAFELYGYGEVRTPVFEQTSLFVKGTGETTDIVQKQMYSIPTGDEETITLRPEGTPPAIRAYLERSLDKQERFQKLYYIGPMFRRERPQRGRLRQFHQLGVEAIGAASPLLDAETIELAVRVFRDAGLRGFETCLNSMGCEECRPRYRADVQGILRGRLEELCPDCRERLERNVFRVIDCKNEGCQRVVEDLPAMGDYLDDACAEHYTQVKAALDRAGLPYTEDPRLVRGLDYYTRTVYEIKHSGLGARDAICGGGRYDNLVELLGGPPLPCVGFAIGAEPTILAMESELGEGQDSTPRPAVYVVGVNRAVRPDCFDLVGELRAAGVPAEMDFEGRSLKAQMRLADRSGAALCFVIGPDEVAAGQVTVRDMAEGTQQLVPWAEAVGRAAAPAGGAGEG